MSQGRQILKPNKHWAEASVGPFNGGSNFFYGEAVTHSGTRVHTYSESQKYTLELLKAKCKRENKRALTH